MFNKITVRGRLILLGVVSVLMLLVVGGVGVYATATLSDALDTSFINLQASSNEGMADMMHDALRADVLQALRGAQRADAELSKAAVEDAKKHAEEFAKMWQANEALPLAEDMKVLIKKVSPEVSAYRNDAVRLVNLAKTDAAAAEADSVGFFALFERLEKSLAGVSTKIEAGADEAKKDAIAKGLFARNVIIVASLIALILIAVFAYLTFQGISSSLSSLQSTVKKVLAGDTGARSRLRTGDELQTLGDAFDNLLDDRLAALAEAERGNDALNNSVIGLLTTMADLSQRDLTVRAPVTEDIIGTLGDSINQLTDATTDVLRNVTQIAGVVEHASRRVKQQSDTVSAQAGEDRITVGNLVLNLKSATTSMQEVARLAETSNAAAADATKTTENAMATVQSTVRGMDSIRETISEMEKRIKRLGERSQEISQIVGLINTISERTHVLSLNASMQAAMAGEAGRGFAVVAEEVQRLAENSRQATSKIATLVQNIQIETNDTIATVNKTIDQVIQGSEMARSSGEKMNETRVTTARLVQLVQTIAQSSEAQMRMVVQLQQGTEAITASTDLTEKQLIEQNQVTSSLLNAAQKLVESVSVFKLSAART